MSKPYPHCLHNLTITTVDDLKFPTQDFGMLYGYGVFETIHIFNKTPLFLKEHIDRLTYGANILDIPFAFEMHAIQSAIDALIAKNNVTESILNLYLTPGDRTIGETKISFSSPLFLAFLRPMPTPIPDTGISLAIREESFQRVRIDQLKTMSYIKNILEKRFAEPFDDVLLYSHDQELLESPVANVFIVKDTTIITPKSPYILPGIVRNFIINNQPYFGHLIQETPLTIQDLTDADEIFLTNSVRGILPVDSVEGIPSLSSGPITHELKALYRRYIETLA